MLLYSTLLKVDMSQCRDIIHRLRTKLAVILHNNTLLSICPHTNVHSLPRKTDIGLETILERDVNLLKPRRQANFGNILPRATKKILPWYSHNNRTMGPVQFHPLINQDRDRKPGLGIGYFSGHWPVFRRKMGGRRAGLTTPEGGLRNPIPSLDPVNKSATGTQGPSVQEINGV